MKILALLALCVAALLAQEPKPKPSYMKNPPKAEAAPAKQEIPLDKKHEFSLLYGQLQTERAELVGSYSDPQKAAMQRMNAIEQKLGQLKLDLERTYCGGGQLGTDRTGDIACVEKQEPKK